MRRLLPVIVLCTVGMAKHAHAQTPGLEETDIAPLADVISTMSDVEIMQMEQTVTDIGSLTPDTEIVVEEAVSEVLAKSTISLESLSDEEAFQQIANANAEFFDFVILDEIALLISEGEFTNAQIRATLEGFNNLSDADKALVGQYNFEARVGDPLYDQVSDAGKQIIATQMPVLLDEDDSQ